MIIQSAEPGVSDFHGLRISPGRSGQTWLRVDKGSEFSVDLDGVARSGFEVRRDTCIGVAPGGEPVPVLPGDRKLARNVGLVGEPVEPDFRRHVRERPTVRPLGEKSLLRCAREIDL